MTAGRILSLRGDLEFEGGPQHIEEVLLTNASPDRTKAWKVLDASIWVEDNQSNATAVVKTGSEFVISMQLQTDTMRALPLLKSTDNRAFGWLRTMYKVSTGASQLVNGEWGGMKAIDPDHVITDQFFATISYSPDSVGENALVTVCWMVVLEEVKIRPIESILQTVKGRSQDVGV